MNRRLFFALLAIACSLGQPAAAFGATPEPAEPDANSAAARAWAVTDTVLRQDVAPPSRQEMFLAGSRALLRQAGVEPPADLGRRVSELTSAEQFRAFLRDVWAQAAAKGAKPGDLEAALFRGLLQPLPGAKLFGAKELKIEDQIRNNRYVGTGIQIRTNPKENYVQVVTVFPRGPARKAGMRAEDLITAVDDTDCRGATVGRVVDLIRGPQGTDVSISVRQPGSAEKRVLKMVRDVVPFDMLVGYRRTGDETWDYRPEPEAPVAYLRVTGLRPSTLQELRRLEPKLEKQGFRALVLDLRSARGDAHQAALVADGLLDGGVLWREYDAAGRVKTYQADRDCLFRGWPIAVLLNGQEDTSAHLFAAALQDNGRAIVIGEPMHGDGFVTSLVPLPYGQGAVQLRTARAVRAKPANAKPADDEELVTLGGWLLRPDHRLSLDRERREKLFLWHSEQERGAPPAGARAPDDPQLAKALEVLRTALKKKKESSGA